MISQFYVLSAAHCFKAFEHEPKLLKFIYTGLNSNATNALNLRIVQSVTIHPQYFNNSLMETILGSIHDLALVEVRKPFIFNENMYPACLFAFDESWKDHQLIFAGYGSTKPIKKEAKINDRWPFVQLPGLNDREFDLNGFVDANATDRIKIAHRKLFMVTNLKFEKFWLDLVVASSETSSTCFGDSGGSLMMTNGSKLFLIGVLSLGIGELLRTKGKDFEYWCYPGSRSLFNLLYLGWIKENTKGDRLCMADAIIYDTKKLNRYLLVVSSAFFAVGILMILWKYLNDKQKRSFPLHSTVRR